MKTKGTVNHTQETSRALGTLYVDASIDQAARKAIRAAVSWGGMVVVIIDAAGYATAHMPGMPSTDRLIAISPWAVVGTYYVKGSDDPRSRDCRDKEKQLADDIQCHWQGLCEARAAA